MAKAQRAGKRRNSELRSRTGAERSSAVRKQDRNWPEPITLIKPRAVMGVAD
jgi:hypothetical protein